MTFFYQVFDYVSYCQETGTNILKSLNELEAVRKLVGSSRVANSTSSAKSRVSSGALSRQELNKGLGYVYLVRCKGFDFYKIGVSKVSVEHRLSSLQTGCPFDLEVLHTGYSLGYRSIETLLHNKYRLYNERGEWFKLNNNLVNDVIMDINKLCQDNTNANTSATFGEQAKIF